LRFFHSRSHTLRITGALTVGGEERSRSPEGLSLASVGGEGDAVSVAGGTGAGGLVEGAASDGASGAPQSIAIPSARSGGGTSGTPRARMAPDINLSIHSLNQVMASHPQGWGGFLAWLPGTRPPCFSLQDGDGGFARRFWGIFLFLDETNAQLTLLGHLDEDQQHHLLKNKLAPVATVMVVMR